MDEHNGRFRRGIELALNMVVFEVDGTYKETEQL